MKTRPLPSPTTKRHSIDARQRGALLALVLASVIACDSGSNQSVDSNSNWVRCEKQSDCDDGFACIEELCQPEAATETGSSADDSVPTSGDEMSLDDSETSGDSSTASDDDSALDEPSEDDTTSSSDATTVGDSGTECPPLADSCPDTCVAVVGSYVVDTCEFDSTTLGCFPRELEPTAAMGCVAAASGELYELSSSSFEQSLTAAPGFSACTNEQIQELQAARACTEPGVACGDTFCTGSARCCDSCQSICADPNDGIVCPDDSEPLRECGGDAGSAPAAESDAEPESDPDVAPDTESDSEPPSDAIAYTAALTNPTGCCDYYTLIRRDPGSDTCLYLYIRDQVGGDVTVQTLSYVEGASDCKERVNGATQVDFTSLGDLSVEYVDGTSRLTASLELSSERLPQALAQPVLVEVNALPTDGEWY